MHWKPRRQLAAGLLAKVLGRGQNVCRQGFHLTSNSCSSIGAPDLWSGL
jgi:hypothetical protein